MRPLLAWLVILTLNALLWWAIVEGVLWCLQ